MWSGSDPAVNMQQSRAHEAVTLPGEAKPQLPLYDCPPTTKGSN